VAGLWLGLDFGSGMLVVLRTLSLCRTLTNPWGDGYVILSAPLNASMLQVLMCCSSTWYVTS